MLIARMLEMVGRSTHMPVARSREFWVHVNKGGEGGGGEGGGEGGGGEGGGGDGGGEGGGEGGGGEGGAGPRLSGEK